MIEFKSVSLTIGATNILDDLDLEVEKGEVLVFSANPAAERQQP